MALKVWDGFDHYNATADLQARMGFLQWQRGVTNPPTITFVTGRDGFGKAMHISTTLNPIWAVWEDRNASAFVGFAFIATTNGSGAVFTFDDTVAAATQVSLYFNPNNYAVQAYRGPISIDDNVVTGTLIGASPNNVWSGQTWVYVEMFLTVDDSAGEIRVNINSEQVFILTGVDTKYTANAWWDRLGVRLCNAGSGVTGDASIDDLYYADTTTGDGLYPANDFLGDARVITLFPVGQGHVDFTPIPAGPNWQMVDEVAMDSDTTYNKSNTVTNYDLFNFTPLTGIIAVIYGVQLTMAARKDDGGVRKLTHRLLSGGTTDYGVEASLPDVSYAYFTDLWILDPDTTSNWDVTGVNAISAGYELTT